MTFLKAWLVAVLFVPTVVHAVSFVPTEIVAGKFAANTRWYTLTIGSSHLEIAQPNSEGIIQLSGGIKTVSASNLWCFVGNDVDGYTIYNKAAGTSKVLCAPTEMLGRTGSQSYVTLQTPEYVAGNGYSSLWMFAPSTDVAEVEGYYMYEKGYEANVVNNRDGALAFWTGGKDHGSTIAITFARQTLQVNLDNGAWLNNLESNYHSQWGSTQTDPQLKLTVGRNNMDDMDSDKELRIYNGNANAYTLSVPGDFVITKYSFKFRNDDPAKEVTIKAGDVTVTCPDDKTAYFAVDDVNESQTTFTSTSGVNAFAHLSEFFVEIGPTQAAVEPSFDVFPTLTTSQIPYRIPAIAQARNGNIVAVADYRPGRADVGSGARIDLRGRVSKDYGETWNDIFVIKEGVSGTDNPAFGDVAMVGDRESDDVVFMCVAGRMGFFQGSRSNPTRCVRFESHDGGETWSQPIEATEQIYQLFDHCATGPIQAMFIGSGRMHQSRYVKAGSHYRVYCALSARNRDLSAIMNYVIYSDDLCKTWKVLGDANCPPIPTGADEPKVEELPNGSIVISSRTTGGRNFNIFTFSNVERGEGSWQAQAFSGASNNGVTALSNACNGELLIVPAKRLSDEKPVYLAFQSVPFGSGRSNVGIYYKELSNHTAHYSTPSAFAQNWNGSHKASSLGSAYSTMVMQQNGIIGFLFEEETYCGTGGGGYTIVYKPYSVETLTDSVYAYDPRADVSDMLKAELSQTSQQLTGGGKAVGSLSQEDVDALKEQYAEAEGTVENLYALHEAIASLPGVPLEEGRWYTLRNKLYPDQYLTQSAADSTFGAAARQYAYVPQLFRFVKAGEAWKVEVGNLETFMASTPGRNQMVKYVDGEAVAAGAYSLTSNAQGESVLTSLNPTAPAYPCLHLNGSKQIVPWTATADASQWYIEPAEQIQFSMPSAGYNVRYYPFAVEIPESMQAFVVTSFEADADTVVAHVEQVSGVPAYTPFVVKGQRGTVTLPIVQSSEAALATPVKGMLARNTVQGTNIFTWTTSGGKIGFRKRSTQVGYVSDNSAYLPYDGQANFVMLSPSELTGIDSVLLRNAEAGAGQWFDLQGRAVAHPGRGIYINARGEKVMRR